MMTELINQQTVKIVESKFFHVMNFIVPGVFVLELFFNRGYFSSAPNTVYEFIIYLVWCILFSIPSNSFQSQDENEFKKRVEILKGKLKERDRQIKKTPLDKNLDEVKLNILKEDIEEIKKKLEELDQEIPIMTSSINFAYTIISIILTYFIYKLLSYYIVLKSYFGINVNLLWFICVNAIVLAIFKLIVYPYVISQKKKNKLLVDTTTLGTQTTDTN